jgi:Tol biopolymer transport system component
MIQDALPNGRVLLSSEESRVAIELVEHGKTEGRDMSWLDNPYNPRLSRDGTVMMFTDQSALGGNEYSVYARKTDGSPAAKIGGGEFGADLSQDGKWALLLRQDDPGGRIQIVPVGPGQPIVLHWDGIQPNWGTWFPDGDHILFAATEKGVGDGTYMTDRSGMKPRLITKDSFFWPVVSPDGRSIVVIHDDKPSLLTIGGDKPKPIPGLNPDELISAWTSDPKVVFVEKRIEGGREIDKMNLDTGKREVWQLYKVKDPVGLTPSSVPASITPDGSKMVFCYRKAFSTLYRSDTLK